MKKLRLFGAKEGFFDKTIEIELSNECIGIGFACGDKKQIRKTKGMPDKFFYHLFDKEEIKDIKHPRIAHIYYSWGPEEDDLEILDQTGLERRLAYERKMAI